MNNKTEELTPDDMADVFISFKISKALYIRISDYASKHYISWNGAVAELLHSCSPGYYYDDLTNNLWWYAPDKDMYEEFNLRFTKPVQEEVFNIFKQTQYKNQTPEMNAEILERLNRALYLKGY